MLQQHPFELQDQIEAVVKHLADSKAPILNTRLLSYMDGNYQIEAGKEDIFDGLG